MINYHEMIKDAEDKASQKDMSLSSIKLLMYELTQANNIDLYANYHNEVDSNIAKQFTKGLKRLLDDEPLAYVLGYQWFYGRKLKVNEHVFIPRYETEELCAYLLEAIDEWFLTSEKIAVADVACGSGAIAITLACEEKKIQCYASELNPNTLEVAKQNAIENNADITFFNGDMLQPLIENDIKLDVLVSNPPYIKTSENLDHSVVDFEPNMALFGGEDGLKFYRIILSQAHIILKEKAIIAFEIGYQQKDELLLLVKEYFPEQRAEVIKDLNGKDRMLFVYVNLSK